MIRNESGLHRSCRIIYTLGKWTLGAFVGFVVADQLIVDPVRIQLQITCFIFFQIFHEVVKQSPKCKETSTPAGIRGQDLCESGIGPGKEKY